MKVRSILYQIQIKCALVLFRAQLTSRNGSQATVEGRRRSLWRETEPYLAHLGTDLICQDLNYPARTNQAKSRSSAQICFGARLSTRGAATTSLRSLCRAKVFRLVRSGASFRSHDKVKRAGTRQTSAVPTSNPPFHVDGPQG